MKTPRSLANPAQWLQILAAIVCAAALTVVLVIGMQRAGQLKSATNALQRVSQLSARPQTIRAELTLIQRELETTAYLGDSLHTVATLRATGQESLQAIQGELLGAGLLAHTEVASALGDAQARWLSLDQELQQLERAGSSGLYSDTPSGSELSATGKRVKSVIDHMLATQTQNMEAMSASLSRLSATLQLEVDATGLRLRALLFGGSTIAVVLLALMLYYAWRSGQSARAASLAQRQVVNILGTVREGLFLIGRDLRIGAICSDSLRQLLRVEAPEGSQLRDLLQPLVDEKTLAAALKFLGLMWKEKVHEDLIESVNPLSQVEVSFVNARGGTDVRYLAFSFRRVRAAGAGDDSVLGVVADVTERVLLARELEQVRADNGSQAALLMQLLHADPEQLQAFRASADVALRKSNAMLTAPGIEQQDLRNKLNGVFRELHTLKGEAVGLALSSFAQRIHAIEDMLQALRGRSALSGNDFVPVVVKLDELINHLGQIQSLHERVGALRAGRSPASARTDALDAEQDAHGTTTVLAATPVLQEPSQPVRTAQSGQSAALRQPALSETLRMIVEETCGALGRSVLLHTSGLEHVPQHYVAAVRNICIHMIRNSIAHGIEAPEERRQLGKSVEGSVHVSFTDEGQARDGGYRLTIEDDGQGLSYENIVDRALRLGWISPQQAVSLERAAVYRLIFQPGFSTTEQVSEHAGRGVGLDAVSALVREHGGKIGVSTVTGRYTRFRVTLPRSPGIAASSAA